VAERTASVFNHCPDLPQLEMLVNFRGRGNFKWPGGSGVNANFASVGFLAVEAARQGEPFQARIID